VAVPTVRFGEIAATIESIARVEGIVVESTVGDGDENGQLESEG